MNEFKQIDSDSYTSYDHNVVVVDAVLFFFFFFLCTLHCAHFVFSLLLYVALMQLASSQNQRVAFANKTESKDRPKKIASKKVPEIDCNNNQNVLSKNVRVRQCRHWFRYIFCVLWSKIFAKEQKQLWKKKRIRTKCENIERNGIKYSIES